jgi:hypothetical protein
MGGNKLAHYGADYLLICSGPNLSSPAFTWLFIFMVGPSFRWFFFSGNSYASLLEPSLPALTLLFIFMADPPFRQYLFSNNCYAASLLEPSLPALTLLLIFMFVSFLLVKISLAIKMAIKDDCRLRYRPL